jgi:hypothetical protein
MNEKPKNPDIQLRNELIWLVVLKLVLLILIWWFFFNDQRVSVDLKTMGDQVSSGIKPIVNGGAK